MDAYEILLREWRKADIKNADELAGRLDSFRVLFAYHSGKIENEQITYHDTREIFGKRKDHQLYR